MNTLVIYDSQFGNTERIAEAIAGALRAVGQAQAIRVDPARPAALQGVDLLILGSPTQGWRPTQAIQSFLARLTASGAHDGLAVAAFDTRFHKPGWLTGSAAKRMASTLRKAGLTPLLPPESFFVTSTQGPLEDGETERATRWAEALREHYEAAHPQAVAR